MKCMAKNKVNSFISRLREALGSLTHIRSAYSLLALLFIGAVLMFLILFFAYILFTHVFDSHDKKSLWLYLTALSLSMICMAAIVILLLRSAKSRMRQTEISYQNRLQKQSVLAAVSQSFIANDDMDVLINNALQMTGEIMEADRIMLAELEKGSENLLIRYEIYNQKLSTPRFGGVNIGFKAGSFLNDRIMSNNRLAVAIDDVEASGYDEARALGVKSAFIIPIYTLGEFWGVLEYDKSDAYSWTDDDSFSANLISGMLSGALTRRSAKEQMSVISDFFRIISNPIFELNTAGAFTKAYSENFSFAGYPLSELIGKRLYKFLVQSDADHVTLELENAVNEFIHVKDLECRVVAKNGDIWDYTLDILPIYDPFGNLTVFRSSYTDVTEKKNKDRELIRLKELAEHANEAKSEFLSRMSHEIRTPMNAIIGMTAIAMKANDPIKKKRSLEKIDDASHHLLGVINDILDMSKIEANKFELSITGFNLSNMIETVTNMITFKMSDKKQSFAVNVDSDVPEAIYGDEQRLSQVITNLLSNATKFTPVGGEITLSVSLHTAEPHDNPADATSGEDIWLKVSVKDNGIGISPEQIARLFNSFEQADGSIARKYGGTGLGLAITKRIVEMMNGRIWIESEPGNGSEFIFIVNVKKGQAATHVQQEVTDSAYKFEGYSILLAEDVEVNRDIIIDLLEETGAVIHTVENGLEALRMYEKHPERCNLILMDVHMPELDGYEATRRIRALGGDALSVPIIAMTANVFREDIEKCKIAGMNDHVGKPIDTEDLLSKINKYAKIRHY